MEQLIKKNCDLGSYDKIYPITSLESIKDLSTGKTLEEILAQYNHIYLPLKDNSRANTRLQIPSHLRRKGLWITYRYCNGDIITEWYNSDDFSNKAWGDCSNWIPYLDRKVVSDLLKDILGWYKA